MPAKVKICGITNIEDALFSAEAGADALGFIFYPKSPRYISPRKAARIIKQLPAFVAKVGVFAEGTFSQIRGSALISGIDTVQLHFYCKPSIVNKLKKEFKVIKVFFPKYLKDLEGIEKYAADAYLFDVHWQEKKTNPDKTLTPRIVNKATAICRYSILSGNIGLHNIEYFLKNSDFWGVDAARNLEVMPGIKNKEKVEKFIKLVKCYEK